MVELTLELTKLILVLLILAFGYALIRFAKKNQETGEKWDWYKFAPTAIYAEILGVIMAVTGGVNLANLTDFSMLMDGKWVVYFSLFTAILYVWENAVVPFIKARLTVTEFYKVTTIDPLNKMNQETRKWLVSDRPAKMQVLVLAAVDEAEAAKTYRYDINSGPWEYLVEFGIVTGGKHYLWKEWLGSGMVVWKIISVACLEAIRTTGKWPDYEKLY